MASFGETLRRERELRGVDLRDVAETTKISIRFLQALENDRVDVLPGGIFPRAFVRQYATYLGLDPDRMVAEFLYAFGRDEAANPSPAAARSRRRSSRPLLLALLLLGLLGVGAWAGKRVLDRDGGPTPAASAPPTTFAADQVYPLPSPSLAPTPGADEQLVLALSARQTCWVSVQADGVKVLDRVLSEGETQTLNARSEFVLSVGNAGGLSFSVNGRPGVPLGQEGQVRRNIVISRQSLPSLLQGPTAAVPPPPG